MSERSTLYDRTVAKLKNNKAVVVGLIGLAILTGVVTFTENVRYFFVTRWSEQAALPLEFSRVELGAEQPWDSIPRERPNYFFEQRKNFKIDPEALRELETLRKRGEYVCPYMFADSRWCTKAAAFFSQQGLQEVAIDPRFDVLVFNPGERPVIVQAIGVEIAYAEEVIVSLGDWETTRIAVDATYEIPMPPFPATWLAHEEIADVISRRSGSDRPVTAQELCLYLSRVGEECEWNLPILTWAKVGDPIYVRGHEPYRFEAVLRDYYRLPNNVVIRFVVETNHGQVFSDYYYLLAM